MDVKGMTTNTAQNGPPGESDIDTQRVAQVLRAFIVSSNIGDSIPHGEIIIRLVDGGVAEIVVAPRYRGNSLIA